MIRKIMIGNKVQEHLQEHKLTYFAHMRVALWFAWTFTKVVLVALCHGVIPSMYKTYCSDKVKEVYNKLNMEK